MPDKVACALSAAIEALVLGSPTLHDAARAEAEDWDDLAITNMIQVLIRRGYEVISPEGEHLALPYSSPEGTSPGPAQHSALVSSSPITTPTFASSGSRLAGRTSIVPTGPSAGASGGREAPAAGGGGGGGAGGGAGQLRVDTRGKDAFQVLIEVVRYHQANEESASAEAVEKDLLKLLPKVYITEGVPRFRSLLGKARNTGYREIFWLDGPTGRPDRIRVGSVGFLVFDNYSRSSSASYATILADYAGQEDTAKLPEDAAHLWSAFNEVHGGYGRRSDDCVAGPHGTDYWPLAHRTSTHSASCGVIAQKLVEPTPSSTATFRSLIWSSCLTKNLELTIRALFTPGQAEQLLRIYGRDTLIPRLWLARKAKSIKDLEIVWESLSVAVDRRVEQEVPEEEKRVLAQYRLDHPAPTRHSQHASRSQTLSGGAIFDQRNTITIDDSPEKVHLQPYNTALVPEFDEERAEVFKTWRQVAKVRLHQGFSSPPPPADMDDVLLQAVGVLAHARWQRNISAWIRAGGLGFFGGLKHPGVHAQEPLESHVEANEDGATEPRLDAPLEQKTQRFWAREGRNALKAAGIACEIDSYSHI